MSATKKLDESDYGESGSARVVMQPILKIEEGGCPVKSAGNSSLSFRSMAADMLPAGSQPPVLGMHNLRSSEGNASATSVRLATDDDVARFMARVVPWPESPNAQGFVNLHWTFWDGDEAPDAPPWAGIPTKSVAEFMSALKWARAQANTRDVYFCLSLQSQTCRNKNGRVVASRSKSGAIALKAIWLDIDVKESPKGYATLTDALAALAEFCDLIGLPAPSATVRSGGGLHVYWISDKSLTLDEWKPYAEGLKAAAIKFGLKCDAGCTTNAAQVLRVPGTFNHKRQPKRLVVLERCHD